MGRALAAVAVAVALLTLSWPVAVQPAASATSASNDTVAHVSLADPSGLADTELVEALQTTGYMDEWLEGTDVSSVAAVLRVDGSSDYEALRLSSISGMFSAVATERAQVTHELDVVDLERAVTERRDALDGVAAQPFGADRDLIVAATELSSATRALEAHAIEGEAMADEQRTARATLLNDFDRMHQLRLTATSPVDRLPLVTLDAYLQGATAAPQQCTVDWTLLAGIGRIESLHGTLDGAAVSANGTVTPRVYGPLLDGGATERAIDAEAAAELAAAEARAAEEARAAAAAAEVEAERRDRELFGIEPTPTPTPDPGDEVSEEEALLEQVRESQRAQTPPPQQLDADEGESDEEGAEDEEANGGNGFAVIADTDAGRLDGNSDWDRAVGPMQFIPRTWELFGIDGNGDGVVDPHNFHDATASAANYLCSLERRNGPDPSVFVLGYNDSTSYVDDVIETSERLDDTYLLPVVTTTD